MSASTKSWAVLTTCAVLWTCSQPSDESGGPEKEADTGRDSGGRDAGTISGRCSPPAGHRCPAGSVWEARHGLNAAAYQQTFDKLVGQGYRLVDVSGYDNRFAGIWTK